MRFLIIVVCLALVGCSVHTRLTRLKDRNENTIRVPYNGTVEEAKATIRQIGQDMKLIEAKAAEEPNFLVLRTNMLKASIMTGLLGSYGGAMASGQTRLGFVFDYDKMKNTTLITISEEVSSLVNPSRFVIEDKLRLAKK